MIIKFLKSFFQWRRLLKILRKVYKDENIVKNLSELTGVEFRQDWVGRIYTVVNPNVQDLTGADGQGTLVYEFTVDGRLSDKMYIEKWIMDKLNIAHQFIQANNLFELLTYSIDPIDEYGNYLLVLEPLGFKDVKKNLKWASLELVLILLAAIILTIIL